MAEAIATTFAEEILKELLRFAADEVGRARNFKNELKELQDRSEMVVAFLADAETNPSNSNAVHVWLKQLRGAIRDADAVLDEFRYEILRRKIEVRGRLTKKVTDFFSPSKNQLAFRLKLAHRIRNVKLKLDHINKEARDIGLEQKIDNASQLVPTPLSSTHPGLDQKNVVGRDGDASIVTSKLLSLSEEEDLPVIAIVGMGGQGKTTLARLVCEQEGVVGRFDEKIWVCVSTDFTVTRLLNEMVQSVTQTNPNLSNNDGLMKLLREKLQGRRYLLILDDVWNDDQTRWNSVRDALVGISGSKGSAIIVTCRDKKVALTMQSSFSHDLTGLSPEDSWSLFERKAFANGGPLKTDNLVEIGKDIVRRCGDVPLVVDVLGGLMYTKKSENEWLAIQNNSVWSSEDSFSNVVNNILKLSYDHLSPPSLKSCFAYLSLFPKDYELPKDRIVQMWTALGLIPCPVNNNFLLEDVGSEYFDLLLGKSLLQEADIDVYGNIKECRMHDLVHDLALETSRGCCLTLSNIDEVGDIPDEVAHLCLISAKRETIERASECFGKLQTLIFLQSSSLNLQNNMFSKLKFLCVLVLNSLEIKELPSSIGKLKHLRFLDIYMTDIKKLPSSITKLYNLQTLIVDDLEEIPENLGNLINLRHFYGEGILIGVGKLTSLQTLSKFIISRDRGCLIEELGGLINLKGKLAIHGLEDVKSLKEAETAKLFEKSNLQELELRWGASGGVEDVLEGLRPPSNLKRLEIFNFRGVKLPPWMMSESLSVLKNLVEIKLEGCDRCEQVPTLGHLPYLKKVVMEGLRNVKRIGEEFYGDAATPFPELRELILKNMLALEEWLDVENSHLSLVKNNQFPLLERLDIFGCDRLRIIPSHFPSLKKLALHTTNDNLELEEMSSGSTALTNLDLSYARSDVKNVLEKIFMNNYRSLKEVRIESCSQLIEFPNNLQNLVALSKLFIESCDKIKVIPDIHRLAFLRSFWILRCRELSSLPRGLELLTSIETLVIKNCSSITSLPNLLLLKRLERLRIGGFLEELDHFPWTLSSSASTCSLQLLTIKGWPKLHQLPQQLENLSALRELYIEDFEGLEALPEWLGNLSSLEFLFLTNLKNVKSMLSEEVMGRLTKLQSLYIEGCPVLAERCVKGSGRDWHKIQHIRDIYIDRQCIQRL